MTSSAEIFDYWTLLGVSPGCDQKEIRNGFKKEALKWHPDLNGNNEIALERFKLVNQAYQVLIDPQKRFAWEIAGRPTVELVNFQNQLEENLESDQEDTMSTNTHTFNTVEKLVIILISIFSLFLADTFIL